MSNQDVIASFFKSKGLSKQAIAGILGNLAIESGFRPQAANGKEGAIGIGQWELGRRTELQAYAAKHGGSEDDLNTQLHFMWAELNGGYKQALQGISHASSAGEAAAIWDADYEHSAGTTRQLRVNAANKYYDSGDLNHITTYTGQDVNTGDGPDALVTGGTPSATKETADSFGDVGSLAESVPQLKALLGQAVAQQWTTEKFQQEVQGTAWWKTHGQAQRQALELQASDPKTYAQNVTTQTATNVQNMQQTANAYGVPVSANGLAVWNRSILAGNQSLDGFKQQMITNAKGIYKGVADQIDAGNTVQQIADPYVQTMSNLLEVPSTSLDVTRTPLIKQALQNVTPTSGESAGAAKAQASTATPLWQFEQQVKADPRWQYTDNAKQAVATNLLQIGSNFGFEGN